MESTSTTLFAPQVRAVQPAFEYSKTINEKGKVIAVSGKATVYFSLSKYNSDADFTNVRYTIVDPNNLSTWGDNSIILDEKKYKETTDKPTKNSNNEYYFEIDFSSTSDFAPLTNNQFYQIQLYLVNGNFISEPSQTSLIRPITPPNVTIDQSGKSLYELREITGSWKEDNPEYLYECWYEMNGYISDKVLCENRRFKIPVNPTHVNPDGNNNVNVNVNFTFKYTTIYGYEGSVETSIILSSYTGNGEKLEVKRSLDEGALLISWEAESKDQLQKLNSIGFWDTIYTVFTVPAEGKVNFKDFCVASGEEYDYRVIRDNKIAFKTSNAAAAYFEDTFLADEDTMFAIRYNPNITNFKTVVQESLTNTLGGQFPVVRSNGDSKYRQFTLSGTIYSNCLITGDIVDSRGAGANLTDVSLPDEAPTLYLKDSSVFNIATDSTDRRLLASYEKKAKDLIMNFLTNKKPKLFRSFEEGNMIVYLSNVSFTPNKTLGRKVYDFSATATEIAEYNITNLNKYKLISSYNGIGVTEDKVFDSYYLIIEDYDGAVTIIKTAAAAPEES